MMLLGCIWIVTLLVIGGANGALYMVEVTVGQKEGRQERQDIQFIDETLKNINGTEVVFKRKRLGNDQVLLILDVTATCTWPRLSSAMTSRGYHVFVTALEECSDYASKELGVNITYTSPSEVEAIDMVTFYDVEFEEKVANQTEYLATVKRHFEADKQLQVVGIKAVCYRVAERLPIRLIYFTRPLTNNEANIVDAILESKYKMEIHELLSFQSFQTC